MQELSQQAIKKIFFKKSIIQYTVVILDFFVLLSIESKKVDNFISRRLPINHGGMLLFVIVSIGVIAINWRCPACKGYLGATIFPKYCRCCERKLS